MAVRICLRSVGFIGGFAGDALGATVVWFGICEKVVSGDVRTCGCIVANVGIAPKLP
jgi:hypothetical protein